MKAFLVLLLLSSSVAAQDFGTTVVTHPIGRVNTKIYTFDPLPDITPYELALATKVLFQSFTINDPELVKKLPPEARRHFRETEARR